MSFKIILQLSIFMIVFGWLALGPYSAYYHQVIDQAKAPIEIMYHAVEKAISDIYLLATNPTEWYARQQVVNVRPENPIDYPKALEVTSIDALPPSVPGGQQFALTFVMKNDGYLSARDIMMSVECNQWCDTVDAVPTPSIEESLLQDDVKNRIGRSRTELIDKKKLFYIRESLDRGESDVVTLTPLVTKVTPARAAETQFAKLKINLSYAYSTSSSLKVSVISDNELKRQFREGETVFSPVVAVGKVSPADLSLNVGPQPLKAGSKSLLLVSVSTKRDKSKVILDAGSVITIRMPSAVGNHLACGRYEPQENENGDENGEVLNYEINQNDFKYPTADHIEILSSEFNSIFSFICTFDANTNVETVQSGFITAELPRFIFVNEQKKDVPTTPPLGIIYEPFEYTCNKCGGGSCTKDKCENVANQIAGNSAQTCFYNKAGQVNLGITSFAGKCSVCGATRQCGKAEDLDTCSYIANRCSWNCVWKTREELEAAGETVPESSTIFTQQGRCDNVDTGTGPDSGFNPSSGSIVEKIVREAKMQSFGKEDTKKIIAVAMQESRLRQCKTGVTDCGDDNPTGVLGGDSGGSMGVFQLNRQAHPDWYDPARANCGGKTAYDENCNIYHGVLYLKELYRQHYTQTITYTCADGVRGNNRQYTGWNAVYRYYNGFPSVCTGDPRYVENVNGQDASQYQSTIEQIYSEPRVTGGTY